MFKFLDRVTCMLGMKLFVESTPKLNQPIIFMQPLRYPKVNSLVEVPFVYGFYTCWYEHEQSDLKVSGSSLPIQLLTSSMRAQLSQMASTEVVLVNPLLEFLCGEVKGIVPCNQLQSAYWVAADHVMDTGRSVADELSLQKPKVRSKLVWNGNTFDI